MRGNVALFVEVEDKTSLVAFLTDASNEPAQVRLADSAFQIE